MARKQSHLSGEEYEWPPREELDGMTVDELLREHKAYIDWTKTIDWWRPQDLELSRRIEKLPDDVLKEPQADSFILPARYQLPTSGKMPPHAATRAWLSRCFSPTAVDTKVAELRPQAWALSSSACNSVQIV